MMWRNVSFVHSIELDFPGNVVPQAIDLGDVDNDKENELVVANVDGELAIFKGISTQPYKKASNLGMITCLRIADICNLNKNLLVCLTAEGCCYFFEVKETRKTTEEANSAEDGDNFSGDQRILTPAFTQNLPANCKAMLIADTDGDGLLEMAVCYSDRAVRTFRWQASADVDSPFAGRLILAQKWQLAGQIGSISISQTKDGTPEVLVSQPGRTYVSLQPQFAQKNDTASSDGDDSKSSFVFHPLGHNRVRNKDVLTVIVGGIQRGGGSAATYHALASLDGSMVLVEEDNILWSLQVDHQLFVLDKLDVTGNGQEEVVCCSWDGQTYIVNHSREVVRYHFKENVAAFAAGYFSVPDKGNVPCFVYATFNNHIVIHHSIAIPNVESTCLLSVMDKQAHTQELLAKLNIDPSKKDAVREMYHYALYGWRPNMDSHSVSQAH